jgi:hypothetical protein
MARALTVAVCALALVAPGAWAVPAAETAPQGSSLPVAKGGPAPKPARVSDPEGAQAEPETPGEAEELPGRSAPSGPNEPEVRGREIPDLPVPDTPDQSAQSPVTAQAAPPAVEAQPRPDELPSTGFEFGPLLMIGFLALCGGAGMLRAVRALG